MTFVLIALLVCPAMLGWALWSILEDEKWPEHD